MATKKKSVKKTSSTARAWEIGGAITAATLAAAAGVYLLSDKKTKTKAKKWVVDARKEVVRHAKAAKKLGEKEYGHIVDEAIKRYGSLDNLTPADVIAVGKQLKGEWTKIHAEAQKMSKGSTPAKKTDAKKKPAVKTTRSKKARA
jgi:hypothetical protein